MRRQPQIIVDAGANIGLASIFFANQFPDASVIAIEPERENFDLLCRNCEPYPSIHPLFAALWSEDSDLNVRDIGNGAWGFITQTEEEGEASSQTTKHVVSGWTKKRLMDKFEIDRIDILKVDIEGSEKEVLSGRPDWIEKVGVLIIETHDWLNPGCELAVAEATPAFEFRWQTGENLVVAREGACIARPTSGKAEPHTL